MNTKEPKQILKINAKEQKKKINGSTKTIQTKID
jgi:hypothetical protein